MQWKPIGIEDKKILDSFFANNKILVSDLTFTNLYLWHYSRHISYIIFIVLLLRPNTPMKIPLFSIPFTKKIIQKLKGNVS